MAAAFETGDLVRRYAALFRWPVAERSIVVEGEHDQRYFALADKLYFEKTGLRLLGKRLAAFPTGIGDDGGAFGLQRHFHPLRAIMDHDLTPDGKKVFHAIALFDDDLEGKRGFGALTGQHLNYKKWRDVFLLQRILPRSSRDSAQVTKLVDEANSRWKGMDCEIEDLVSLDVIKAFVADIPAAVFRPTEEKAGGAHSFFKPHVKASFIRFVEANALLCDVASIIEVLKSLRFHLGLTPDGDPDV
jgi:hypothetical protein